MNTRIIEGAPHPLRGFRFRSLRAGRPAQHDLTNLRAFQHRRVSVNTVDAPTPGCLAAARTGQGHSMGGTTAGTKQGTGAADLAAMVVEAAQNYDGTALRYYDGDELKDMSYEEVGQAAREIAGGLIELGVEPGQR